MQNPENSVQDADSLPEIADNSEQSKTEQNKADENKGLPPLTPRRGRMLMYGGDILLLSFRDTRTTKIPITWNVCCSHWKICISKIQTR